MANASCRVTPIGNIQSLPQYDKEKYKEMILGAAETVLGFFGFNRAAYGNLKRNNGKRRWYEELREQSARDIKTEMSEFFIVQPQKLVNTKMHVLELQLDLLIADQ